MTDGKTFTRAELAAYDGREGRPAYVAYKGRVIDVTVSTMWRGGSHMKRHVAGQDLTAEIASAPHDVDVLDRFTQVKQRPGLTGWDSLTAIPSSSITPTR